jgi:FAD/FMN-containing dehydrogenase
MALNRRRFISQAAAALAAHSLLSRAAEASAPPLDETAFHRLASTFSGTLITPASPDYATSRQMFNRAFDKHPALIARCANAADVARALVFAREQRLPLSVRGGGHNRAGLSVCDDGVVVDLAALGGVTVDADRKMARAGAGALTVNVDVATQKSGLATTLAGCPTVGIAGLTLGGGEGFLMTKFGAACDNLVSARLVTADGQEIEASESSHPDLFWAIRGGGGNFGIATALEYRLHPLTDVLAGTLAYAPGRIDMLMHEFAKLAAHAPDDLGLVGQVLPAPGGARFQLLVCHAGDAAHGNELLRPWRALGPTDDKIRTASYLEVNSTMNPAAPAAHFQTNVFVRELDAKVISIIVNAAAEAPPGTRVFMVPFYGAITRVRPTATAFALRSVGVELDIMGRWDDTGKDKASVTAWVTALRDALRPQRVGAYVNQLGETSDDLVRAAYGPNYARLASLKKKYDPDNVFRSNQNIRT